MDHDDNPALALARETERLQALISRFQPDPHPAAQGVTRLAHELLRSDLVGRGDDPHGTSGPCTHWSRAAYPLVECHACVDLAAAERAHRLVDLLLGITPGSPR